MTQTRTATVVAGTLQLDEPLDLPEKSRVTVAVTPQEDEATRQRRREAMKKFFESVDEVHFVSNGERFTREQLHERR